MKHLKYYSLIAFLLLMQFQRTGYAEFPERIISLDLCSDWMLVRYAKPSQHVTYSPLLYRYALDWIPAGLPVHDGSLEQLLQLEPDLVISGEFNATLLVRRLRQLGTRVAVMPMPQNLQATEDYIRQFTTIINAPLTAQRLTFHADKKQTQKLLVLGANGIAAGADTLENDVLQKSGWSNYLSHSGFVSLDLEQLVAQPPDAILYLKPVTNSLSNLFARHPVLAQMNTVKASALSDVWRWQCPGPWTFDLVKELARWKDI